MLHQNHNEEVPSFELSPEQQKLFNDVLRIRPHRDLPKVMIVEDQVFSRQILYNMLTRSYNIYSASTAEEAFKYYIEYAPDIVFLDIMLPGISGHEFATIIRNLDPNAFIIMVTASNNLDDIKRAHGNGVAGFIVKPYNKQKILDCIQKYRKNRKSS